MGVLPTVATDTEQALAQGVLSAKADQAKARPLARPLPPRIRRASGARDRRAGAALPRLLDQRVLERAHPAGIEIGTSDDETTVLSLLSVSALPIVVVRLQVRNQHRFSALWQFVCLVSGILSRLVMPLCQIKSTRS